MTRLVDTTIRLLSQDPLAPHMPTARVLAIAERMDDAGYAALEVTGGGCFTSAVNRAVESPWERIRAIKARVSRTPLVMALRGTFLVGPKPADADLVRRFILCAAESGIDAFRLHDPLNDMEDLEGRPPPCARRAAGSSSASSTRTSRTASTSSTAPGRPRSSAPTGSCCTTLPAPSTRRTCAL
jgi:pyruvate/oxaloacetate carboxyltransferase